MSISLDPRTFLHMLPQEREIWSRYLPTIVADAISVDYDVHLGAGLPAPPGSLPGTVRQVEAVTRKRVDAVVLFPEYIVIYEVKVRAGMSAYGQLKNYRRLYISERSPAQAVHMAVVCERIEPDVIGQFRDDGIEVYVV